MARRECLSMGLSGDFIVSSWNFLGDGLDVYGMSGVKAEFVHTKW